MSNKEYAYTVRGSWPLVADLLRYDDARAATPADQKLLNRMTAEEAPDLEAFSPVEINLVGPRRPTYGRWASRLWTVTAEKRA